MRYEAVKIGDNTWGVYDNYRKVKVLSSVSPNAKYNQEVAKNAAEGLNRLKELRK